jgi:hypothetical protein
MWFIFVNIILTAVYWLKGSKDAELVTVSFEGTTDGYAVDERAELIANTNYSIIF